MRTLTESEQKVFDAYVEKENQRIATMPLKNTRRFFVDDTPPANFIEDYQWLKEMVLDSYLLLKPEQRPDGEFLHDIISMFDVFIDELKQDIENCKEHVNGETVNKEKSVLETYKNEIALLAEKNVELNKEIGGLQACLAVYTHNKDFFNEVDFMAGQFSNGNKSESETQIDFIKAIGEKWSNFNFEKDFERDSNYTPVFNSLMNSIASDYMLGQITEQEAQQRFIDWTRQFWKMSPRTEKNEAA